VSKPRTSPVLNNGLCDYCGEVLVQRNDEPYYNWIKRRTCNKAHAALIRQKNKREGVGDTTALELKSGVVRYKPGTPEFDRLVLAMPKPLRMTPFANRLLY
jgi:hypothetical protein